MKAASIQKQNNEKIYGLRAVLAVLKVRPQEIVNAYWSSQASNEIKALQIFWQTHQLGGGLVSQHELDRLSGSSHNEGVLVETKQRIWLRPEAMAKSLAKNKGICIALDRVRNPYNIGAIARSAAFFGAKGIMFGAFLEDSRVLPAAYQVAEGGAEYIQLSRTTDLAVSLAMCKKLGISVFGAEHNGEDIHNVSWQDSAILVVGHEREGISTRVLSQCDRIISIKGVGSIQSLNVAIATSLILEKFTDPMRYHKDVPIHPKSQTTGEQIIPSTVRTTIHQRL